MTKLKKANLRNAHCRCSVVRRLRSTALKMKMISHWQRELNSRSLFWSLKRQWSLLSRRSRMLGSRRAKSTRCGISSTRSAHSLIGLFGSSWLVDLKEFPRFQSCWKITLGKEPSRGINPDEAVAYDPAIQGAFCLGSKVQVDNVTCSILTPLLLVLKSLEGYSPL